jgi:phosphoadenosine phosphosulfate reductase
MPPQTARISYAHDSAPTSSLRDDFNLNALNEQYKHQTLKDRLDLAQQWTQALQRGKLALNSSFGIQSALLLHAIKTSGLKIPVVTVDIPGKKYDAQRRYRETLRQALDLDLIIFQAESEADKVAAMNRGLKAHDIRGTISGIRASQTETRAGKKFIEISQRNGTLSFHPLLDWPDAKAEFYLNKKIPPSIRHPDYRAGIRSKGGVILDSAEEKTECGLHL